MSAFNRKLIFLPMLLGAIAACSNAPGTSVAATASSSDATGTAMKASDPPRSVDAKAYCAKLQSVVQSKVKIPLSLFKADDNRSDETYADDPTYASCTFDSNGKRVTVIARATGDMMERDKRNGLTPVSGYGDQAFYSGEKGGQLHWVDVVRGSDSCEALLGVEQTDLGDGDFSKAAGQICVAALAAR